MLLIERMWSFSVNETVPLSILEYIHLLIELQRHGQSALKMLPVSILTYPIALSHILQKSMITIQISDVAVSRGVVKEKSRLSSTGLVIAVGHCGYRMFRKQQLRHA